MTQSWSMAGKQTPSQDSQGTSDSGHRSSLKVRVHGFAGSLTTTAGLGLGRQRYPTLMQVRLLQQLQLRQQLLL